MNENSGAGTAFGISIGLAFVGGYADASSYLLARTIQVLAPMWISSIFGAFTGAVIVSCFHSIGLLGITAIP